MDRLAELGWAPFILLAAVQFIARPLSVVASTIRSNFSWREKKKLLLAWIGPRNCRRSSFCAVCPQASIRGVVQAELLVPCVYRHHWYRCHSKRNSRNPCSKVSRQSRSHADSLIMVPRWLRVPLHRSQTIQYSCSVDDSSWDNIRLHGWRALKPSLVTPYPNMRTKNSIWLASARSWALSPQRDLKCNCQHAVFTEFGQSKVYMLLTSVDTNTSEKHQISAEHRVDTLFDQSLTYSKFASLLSQGATLRKTRLTEEFTFDNHLETKGQGWVPLFAITPKGKLRFSLPTGSWRLRSAGRLSVSSLSVPPAST